MALSVPIWVRSSVTMRVMVVMQTNAATRTKKIGNTTAMPSMIALSFSKVT